MSEPRLTISWTGIPGKVGEFDGHSDHSVHLPLPSHVSEKELEIIQKDCELFASKIANHPDEFAHIISCVSLGKLREANQVAQQIGLTETEFQREGGGILWWIVAAGVAAGVLWASDAL